MGQNGTGRCAWRSNRLCGRQARFAFELSRVRASAVTEGREPATAATCLKTMRFQQLPSGCKRPVRVFSSVKRPSHFRVCVCRHGDCCCSLSMNKIRSFSPFPPSWTGHLSHPSLGGQPSSWISTGVCWFSCHSESAANADPSNQVMRVNSVISCFN